MRSLFPKHRGVPVFAGGNAVSMPMDAAMGMPDMDMGSTAATMAGMEDEMGHGFMAMRDLGEQATITFTVTAAHVGEWEMACFEEDGAHYDDGMKGTFTVES